MNVVKRHKRLHVVDRAGRSIYSPPDFVRVPTREAVQRLANAMLPDQDNIGLIMDFEDTYTIRRK